MATDQQPAPAYDELEELELPDDTTLGEIIEHSRRRLTGEGILDDADTEDPDTLKLAGLRIDFIDENGVRRSQMLEAEGYESSDYDHVD